jgi:hypothetical protein
VGDPATAEGDLEAEPLVKVKIYVILATIAVALASATAAGAANSPHPKLDGVATQVAGKPVSVHCETDEYQWRYWENGSLLHGFTYLSTPVVYIAPKHCYTLHFALKYGYREVGVTYLSDAIATLVHEAVHQRGIRDECQTEKVAQSLVMSVAEQTFGLSRTVSEAQYSTKTLTKVLRRKIAGKWRSIKVPTQLTTRAMVQVPNSDYARFQAWALVWHNGLPAQYKNC